MEADNSSFFLTLWRWNILIARRFSRYVACIIEIFDHIYIWIHIFQVEDLAVASPATVSRCGMVYNDCVDLGTQPFIDSWLEKKDKGPYEISYNMKIFSVYMCALKCAFRYACRYACMHMVCRYACGMHVCMHACSLREMKLLCIWADID